MNTLTFIDIPNVMLPHESSRHQIAFADGRSLAELFPAVMGEAHASYVWTLDGKMVEDGELALAIPRQGSKVTRAPMPAGGGGGGTAKSIVRMVALIAIMIYAPELAGAFYSSMGGTFVMANAGLIISGITAGIVVGGSMLVNAVLPPPKAASAGSTDSSASYGVDGAKNTSAEGVVVPLVYGTFRYGGNILDNYVVNDGQTQYLYMLICAGEGPIASITDVRINDQPWSIYDDCVLETTHLGQSNQEPISWFADTIVPNSLNLELDFVNWNQYTTKTAVDKIRIDIVAPSGLFQTSNTGSTGSISVNVAIQYRKSGTSTWLSFPASDEVNFYQDVINYNQVADIDANGNPTGTYHDYVPTGQEYWDGDTLLLPSGMQDAPATVVGSRVHIPAYNGTGVFLVEAAQRSAYRRSFQSTQLPNGVYDIRIKRNTVKSTKDNQSDSIYISDVNEITIADVGYVNTALLGLKIKLSDQISGMPTVTHMNGGKLVRCWSTASNGWDNKASSNPAWIALDILTNKRYGGGVSLSRIDLDAWKEWAAWCDGQGLTFNGVFDTQTNVWDAAVTVMRCGHAALFQVGSRYSVNIERDAAPTMMFSSANMVSGTFKENWLPLTDRANEINITFPDKDDDYRSRTMKLYDPEVLASGAPTRVSNITIQGVVDKQRAYDEMVLQLNLNRLITRTISFSAPIEAIACTVGDVVLVSHDMPSWGDSGRCEAGSTTTTVNLDHAVTMTADKAYAVMAIYDTIQRASGTGVASVVGQNITLNGYAAIDTTIKRLVIQGHDLEVTESFTAGSKHGVTVVGDCSMITTGANAWKVYDTNVLVTRTVSTVVGDQSVLTLPTPLPAAPTLYQKWMFGEVNKVGKPFKVSKISGTHEYNRDIDAVEFDSAVYSGILDAPDIDYSDLDAGVVQSVTIDAVTETQVLNGTVWIPNVTCAWHSLQQTYMTADVWLSTNGSIFAMVGSDPGSYTTTANKGDLLVFKIVARDRQGRMQPMSNAPIATYTVQGRQTAPGAVTGLAVTPNDSGLYVTWNRPVEPDWSYTTIKLDGADYTAATQLFQDRLTSCSTNFLPAGAHTFRAKNTIPEYDSVAEADVTFTVLAPKTITFVAPEINNGTVVLPWTSAKTTQSLRRHIVRKGAPTDAYTSLTDYAILPGSALSATVIFPVSGTYRIWVVAEDGAGNQGAPAYKDVTVAAFGVPPNLDPPPVPVGVALTPGYDSVFFSWDTPAFTEGHGYSAMIVWGATVVPGNLPVFTDAKLVGTFIGTAGFDPCGPGLVRRYWFAYRSVDGVVGTKLGGTNGLAVTTGTDVTGVLATLNGAITQSQLYTDLGARIDMIGGPATAANLAQNPGFDPAVGLWVVDSLRVLMARTVGAVPTGAPADFVYKNASRDAPSTAPMVPVAEGETFDMSFWAASHVKTAVAAGLMLYLFDTNGTQIITSFPVVAVAPAGAINPTWDQFSGSYTVPAGSGICFIRPVCWVDQPFSGGTETVYFAQPVVNRRSGSGAQALAQIQVTQAAVAGLGAEYTVKIDDNGYVSGFGLASTPNNGAPSSSFIVRADKFSVASPTGPGIAPRIPFYVVTTSFVQNGVTVPPGVYMDNAFIANGTIVSAMIGTAAITSANIGDLQVTTAKIGELQVGTTKITGNAVTMPVSAFTAGPMALAMSGSVVQSVIINCTGAMVELFGGCSVQTGFNGFQISGSTQYEPSNYTATVYRDGLLLARFPGLVTAFQVNSTGILVIPPIQDNPGSGQHTYTLFVSGGSTHNSHTVSNRSLFAIEVKK